MHACMGEGAGGVHRAGKFTGQHPPSTGTKVEQATRRVWGGISLGQTREKLGKPVRNWSNIMSKLPCLLVLLVLGFGRDDGGDVAPNLAAMPGETKPLDQLLAIGV